MSERQTETVDSLTATLFDLVSRAQRGGMNAATH